MASNFNKLISFLFKVILLFLPIISFSQFGPQEFAYNNQLEPTNIKTGDIDNDNDIDIVVTYSENSRIVWYENKGNGQFEQETLISNSIGLPHSIDLADFDNDGDLDVVSASSTNTTFIWFENKNGLGSFAPKIEVSIESYSPLWVIAKDIDGDDNIDILTASGGDGKISWFPNKNGDGVFGEEILISDFNNLKSIFIVDINSDTHPDIITASSFGLINWYENIQGEGNFSQKTEISSTTNNARSITSADFDNDGDNDIAVSLSSGFSNKKIIWFENMDGLGGFSDELVLYDQLEGLGQILAKDIDNDGLVDILATSSTSNTKLLHNLGNNMYEKQNFGYHSSLSIEIDDLNNDNRQDLLIGFDDGHNLKWYEQKENGSFSFNNISYTTDEPKQITAGDLNADDQIQFIAHLDNKLVTFQNSLDSFKIINQFSTSSGNLTVIDLDGDGDMDIFNGTGWSNNDGTGSFSEYKNIPNYADLDYGYTFDIDNDGDLDLIAHNHKVIRCYENVNGFDSLNFINSFELEGVGSIIHMDFGDLNIDGFFDIIINSSIGDIIVYNNENGNNFSEGEILINNNMFAGEFGLFDLDGDNDLDIVISTFENGKHIVWYENQDGFGDFSEDKFIGTTNRTIYKMLNDDIDLDNDLDIILVGQSEIFLLENNDNSKSFKQAELISDGHTNISDVELIDIDFDGYKDLLVTSLWDDKIVFHKNYFNSPKTKILVFNDENENGSKDNNEFNLANQKIIIEPNEFLTWTDHLGESSFTAINSNYTVYIDTVQNWKNTTDSIITLDFTNEVVDTTLYFGLIAETEIIQSEVHLNSGPTRCGFTVPFYLNVSNSGTETINGIVEFKNDTLCTFIHSEPLPDSIENNVYFWFIDSLRPSLSEQILLSIEMPGVDFLGEYVFFESNFNAIDEFDMITYTTNSSYLSQINCAYDPNDKQVQIPISNSNNYTFFDDTLLYTIRFQNTGTDTAINIKIIDDLDINLDWSTFESLASSHNFYTQINDDGRVTFYFNNIYLPDSITNEVKSHGFISYRINTKDQLPEMTEINNTAQIYFDFNPPIITNTVSNNLISEFPIYSVSKEPSCYDSEDGFITITNADNEFDYNWNTGHSGSYISDIEQGVYSVEMISKEGIKVADSTFILSAPPALNILDLISSPATGNMANGIGEVNVEGGVPPYTYLWNSNPPQTNSIATNLFAGVYVIQITDSNDCILIDSLNIEMISNIIQNEETPLLKIAPNPSAGFIEVLLSIDPGEEWELILTDVNGRVIIQNNSSDFFTGQKIRFENLTTGIYQLSLILDTNIYTHKVIVID